MKILDSAITNSIKSIGQPVLPVAVFITKYGLYSYALITLAVAYLLTDRLRIVWFLIPVVATFLVTMILQHMFRRARPERHDELYKLFFTTFSFPSAHSSVSFSFATCLSILFLQYEAPQAWIFVAGFYLLASLIALSRVVVGVHYFFDTLIGALLGIVISVILIGM